MNEVKNKIKAVIFDMDGTIVKTEHIWHKVVVDVLAECGVKELTQDHKELLKELSGSGMQHSCRFLKEKFELKESVDYLRERKIELAHTYFEQNLEFIDGFELFHAVLQKHAIPTSIATNADRNSLNRISNKLNFTRFFGSNMYCVADVNFVPKPSPDLFLHSASMLGAIPDDCVVFEDSNVGFEAAKAAGMKCVGIQNIFNQSHLNKVHCSIKDYSEAEEALKKIAKIDASGR